MNSNYDKRINSLATIMAEKKWPTSKFLHDTADSPNDFYFKNWYYLITLNHEAAKEETSRTRMEVESIMRKVVPWKETAIISYLEEDGLIPPQTQTT